MEAELSPRAELVLSAAAKIREAERAREGELRAARDGYDRRPDRPDAAAEYIRATHRAYENHDKRVAAALGDFVTNYRRLG